MGAAEAAPMRINNAVEDKGSTFQIPFPAVKPSRMFVYG